MDYRDRLLAVAHAYREARGLSLSRVSTLVQGGGSFLDGLANGKGCTVDTYERSLQWFSDHWPENAAWPPVVARPVPHESAA